MESNAVQKSRLSVICSDCQTEVSDPVASLGDYHCPRCYGPLIRLAVPNEAGFDRPLPVPGRTNRHAT
jgi:hypothetical protein